MGDDAARDERLEALMDAVVLLSSELEIAAVLEHLVAAGCRLTGARYGALGVLGEHGGLEEFVHRGIDAPTVQEIGHLPRGRGVLGHLIASPELLRLHDLATHASSVGFPEHHPAMRSFLGVPVRARGVVFGNLYLTEKQSTESPSGTRVDFTADDERTVVTLAAAAGVAIGHARAFRQVREHEKWLEVAEACAESLTSGLPRDEAVAAVLDRVRVAASAQVALLVDVAERAPAAVRAEVLGHRPALRAVQDGTDAGVPGEAWVLALPLRSADRWVAGLLLAWPASETGPRIDLVSVAGFAEQLALALDVAEAQSDRARLAVLEERERIARDLHDMVIQRLFAIGLGVQGAAQEAVSPEVSRRLEIAVDELDETIKDVRTTIFRLGARGRLAATGLRDLVDAEVVQARSTLGFLPRLRVDGVTAAVPTDVAQDAVAVVREALANVARHAHAREVVVRVVVGADLLVEVQDDGTGTGAVDARSGLVNLEERARRRGGVLRVEPVLDGGTLLTWSVPLSL